MIETINNKALKLYYETGDGSKLPPQFLAKITRVLSALDAITSEKDIMQLGSGIHKLTGNLKQFWSIKISANYRIVFRFEEGNVFEVDYIDYH